MKLSAQERRTLMEASMHSYQAYEFELNKIAFKKLKLTANPTRTLKRIRMAIIKLMN